MVKGASRSDSAGTLPEGPSFSGHPCDPDPARALGNSLMGAARGMLPGGAHLIRDWVELVHRAWIFAAWAMLSFPDRS